jgi:hypothetical protein
MYLSDSFGEPIVAIALLPVLVLEVKIGWDFNQILTWNHLWCFLVEKLYLGRPYIFSIIKDHKESIITASKGI